ncbi:MAG: hypothetical protein PHW82_16320, partial [Bacteroidales bacterium]|nr:hypothetical protein [Bacteroidales bacterium]
MENVITIGTDYLDFEYGSQNYYQDMYQIHIFSPFYIQSYFYDPQEVSEDYVKSKALEWQSKIKKNTSYDLKISLYNHSGIFLITDG